MEFHTQVLCTQFHESKTYTGHLCMFCVTLFFQMKKCILDGLDVPTKYNIKLSGDGAKMTRLTGFVIISFSILNAGEAVLGSKG